MLIYINYIKSDCYILFRKFINRDFKEDIIFFYNKCHKILKFKLIGNFANKNGKYF